MRHLLAKTLTDTDISLGYQNDGLPWLGIQIRQRESNAGVWRGIFLQEGALFSECWINSRIGGVRDGLEQANGGEVGILDR